ncbi:MAG: hypothetical protein JSW46_13805 [Gemmatimonadota bacterium]|nr:MAG: hypothetical protein JSW46_13805 [Gemmatimonadota bacterium]
MLSVRGWARLLMGTMAVTVIGLAACQEDDALYGPLVDTAPPVVSITDAQTAGDTLTTTVDAEDFIALAFVVTEIRRTDQFETVITEAGDTIVLGRLIAVDTTRFVGRTVQATVSVTFFTGFTTPTNVQIRAIAVDSQDNEATASAVVTVAGTTGGPLGAPTISIYSPLPNSTVRDNTLIRVGVRATDPSGLQQLNVVLTNPAASPPAIPAADTIRFAVFRTDVDTLLDFFIPQGALGTLTITAEAINLNTLSAQAQISVTVATEVPDDTNPPIVSMLVTGGTQRRTDEPPRMEVDDSLLFNITALDQETAITRVGVTVIVRNDKTTGTVIDTIFMDSVMSPAISGTVPVNFGMMPLDLPATVFTEADVPDTLFFQLTGWAFDAATPTANCGATVDPEGSVASLACSGGGPVHALGVQGGFLERLIVAGRTVGIPQGALIADAVVDTIRELMLLSDFNFGIVRPFDLRNEVFLDNVPVGSDPWGVGIDLTEDRLLVGNSGGTNISVVDLGPRSPGAPAVGNEIDRFQTQDIKVFRVEEKPDALFVKIFPVTPFDYSDRPQFLAQAANGFILFSTVPAKAGLAGTIREYDPIDREIRFFVDYADRASFANPQIQIINADSVLEINGARQFAVCDHTRGNFGNPSCIIANDSLADATLQVAAKILSDGWDVEIFSNLDIGSIALTDTTLVAASGDREYIAFGEGDTPGRAGRVMLYRSADESLSNGLQVTDLTGNAEEKVFGLALNLDGSVGVVRGTMAYFFGPDPSGINVLRMLGTNDRINPDGAGAALHPDNDITAAPPAGNDPSRRLTFLGSGDARVEIVDAFHYEVPRGNLLIRDPILGPLRISRRLPPDPAGVILKLYGITANGVVVIPVKDTDIIPF